MNLANEHSCEFTAFLVYYFAIVSFALHTFTITTTCHVRVTGLVDEHSFNCISFKVITIE